MRSRSRIVALIAGVLLLLGCTAAVAVPVPNPDPCQWTGSASEAKILAYEKCRFDRLERAIPGNQTVTTTATATRPPVTVTAPPSTVTATATVTLTVTAGTPTSSSPTSSPSSTSTSTPPPATGWPGASNTGVPAGTVLTPYTGPSTITTAGTVIDSKRITSCVVVRANNVVIKNSLLQTNGCFFNILSDNGNTGMQITDSTIDGQNNSTGDSAINGGGFTCLRCNIFGTVDGIKAQSNVVIQDSYIHDLVIQGDSHNDGIQSLGTTSLKVLHNNIVMKDGATSAIILSTGSASDMRNVQIDGNLLGGGAFTIYGGYQAGTDTVSKVSNISITNNKFTTAVFPRSGAYGPLTSTDSPVVVTGNTWADGPNAGGPVA